MEKKSKRERNLIGILLLSVVASLAQGAIQKYFGRKKEPIFSSQQMSKRGYFTGIASNPKLNPDGSIEVSVGYGNEKFLDGKLTHKLKITRSSFGHSTQSIYETLSKGKHPIEYPNIFRSGEPIDFNEIEILDNKDNQEDTSAWSSKYFIGPITRSSENTTDFEIESSGHNYHITYTFPKTPTKEQKEKLNALKKKGTLIQVPRGKRFSEGRTIPSDQIRILGSNLEAKLF